MNLEWLSNAVRVRLGDKRYAHTLGVERMARRLGEACLPDALDELSAAALLHDVAKELSDAEQMQILKKEGITLSSDELSSPQIFHSYTAPHVIRSDFSEFATERVLSAVYKHTVGAADMSVFDEIVFLSDYIEEGRAYQACVALRERVLSSLGDDIEGNRRVLHAACIAAIDNTVQSLEMRGMTVISKTVEARKALLDKIKQN